MTTTLSPEIEGRVVELARVFRSAARAVSFYPSTHPAIGGALNQLVDVAHRATLGGALPLSPLPGSLLVSGCALSRPDPSLAELAAILHRHGIGAFTLHGASDVASWRTLLQLLARPPEDVRADGGIRRLWSIAGSSNLEIHEIDYAELLRGRIGGDAAELASIINHYLEGGVTLSLEDAALKALCGLAESVPDAEPGEGEPERRVVGKSSVQAAAILRVLRGLCDVTTLTQPERFDAVFSKAATVGTHLTVEVMQDLIAARGTPEAMVGSVDVVSALLDRMDDGTVAGFLSSAIVAEGGASQRLAEAFSCIVQDQDRRRQVLSLTQEQMADSSLVVEEGFLESWNGIEQMLESYSDRAFVSDDYSKELNSARTRAVEIEQLTEDPPERIATWLATIDDGQLRLMDLQLLLDLLSVETDPFRWHEVLDTAVSQVEDLARIGHFESAARLTAAIAYEASEQGRVFRRPFAVQALDLLLASPLLRHLFAELRTASDSGAITIKQLFKSLGPGAVGALAEVWSVEEGTRTRERLQQIVVGFGARGREAVQKLMNAANWEVRRAAVYLLREFGESEDLGALKPLLHDTDPRVRREAFQTIALGGEDTTFRLLLGALSSATPDEENLIVGELVALKSDERAGPMFCYLMKTLNFRNAPKSVYLVAIDALGRFGGPDAARLLGDALHRGSWSSPFRTRSFRRAAAAALFTLGSPGALQVLREASTQGCRDVRGISRSQLAKLRAVPS